MSVAMSNRLHAAKLAQSLSSTFCFTELESRLTELQYLVEDCTAFSISLAQLAVPLDAAAAAQEEVYEPSSKRQRSMDSLPGERPCVIDVCGIEPRAARALLVCAGRYCSVIGQPALALGHFRAALATGSPASAPPIGPSTVLPDSCAAEAQMGMAQSALALGLREPSVALALHFWRSPHSVGAAACSRAHMQLAFILSSLAGILPTPPPDALVLLRRLSPLLGTPACSALESLAESHTMHVHPPTCACIHECTS